MADEKQLIDIEGLSHFKSKLDNEYNEKFKSKNDSTDLKGAVRYDTAQVLTEEQKAQARANIGVSESGGSGGGTVEGAVRHDVQQILDDDDKARARANIGTTDGTWANMPDKPFGMNGWMLEWDGIPKEPYIDMADTMGAVFCKVGEVKTKEELIGATCKIDMFNGDNRVIIEQTITQSEIMDIDEGCFVVHMTDAPMAILLFSVLEVGTYNIGIEVNFESEGIWFVKIANEEVDYFLTSLGKGEIKKIDKSFLPDDINVELPEGIVTTDSNGLIPTSVLPSFVDDVLEGWVDLEENKFYLNNGFREEREGEKGKIYVDFETGNIYRWSGTQYVRINPDEYTVATNADIDALFT